MKSTSLLYTSSYQITGRFTAVTENLQKTLCRRVMPAAQQLYLWLGRLAPPGKSFELYLDEFVEFSGYCLRHARRAIDQLIEYGLVEVKKWYHRSRRYFLGVYHRPEHLVESDSRTFLSKSDQKCPEFVPQPTEIRGSLDIDLKTTPTHPVVDELTKEDSPTTNNEPLEPDTRPLENKKERESKENRTEQRSITEANHPPSWLERVLERLKRLGVIVSGALIERLRRMTAFDISHGLRLLEEAKGVRNPTGYFLAACTQQWRSQNGPTDLPETELLKRWRKEGQIVASMMEQKTLLVAVGTIDNFQWMTFEEAKQRLATPPPRP